LITFADLAHLPRMPKMKAAQVSAPGADFEIVERDIPDPGRGQVRVKVQACGICHSDVLVKEGHWPGIRYPRIPGHEVAGLVDAVGPEAVPWTVGQRVGVGWHGGQCGRCRPCREGDFAMCANLRVTGIHFDGGYAEYMIAPIESVALIPDSLAAVEAGPLMCAGITTYNALRNSGARGGDVVAVQALGGLGHLGVQFANKLGFHTVAISRGTDKADLARTLGAHVYIDTESQNAAEELKRLGGAKVILATAPSGKAVGPLIGGLAPNGRVIVIGAGADAIELFSGQLIAGGLSVQGWFSGIATDSEDAMRFAALTGVHPMIETYPLAQVEKAYQRMIGAQARFRAVLTMD
jgi:D-arabinose 1-dehydrogenase-like Zn-dependent alcohol dehydrogenase